MRNLNWWNERLAWEIRLILNKSRRSYGPCSRFICTIISFGIYNLYMPRHFCYKTTHKKCCKMSAIYCISSFSIRIYILSNVQNLINGCLCKDAFCVNDTNDSQPRIVKTTYIFPKVLSINTYSWSDQAKRLKKCIIKFCVGFYLYFLWCTKNTYIFCFSFHSYCFSYQDCNLVMKGSSLQRLVNCH